MFINQLNCNIIGNIVSFDLTLLIDTIFLYNTYIYFLIVDKRNI